MNQLSHTPGPWKISDLNVDVDGEEDILIEYEGFPLCTVRGTNDMSCIDGDGEIERINNEVIANARLIAAAPDLLEALEKAVYDLETVDGLGLDRIVLNMKDAIKKAKGI